MKYRRFGKTDWQVAEIGYGMWGLAGWTGTEEQEMLNALQRSVELGCNFFDTAWAYGAGVSEKILGRLIDQNTGVTLYAASKIAPKNLKWPSQRGFEIKDVFPAEYIEMATNKSLRNLGLEQLDLMQFHVWEDDWATNEEWQRTIENLTAQGKVAHWGISINRWEPWNAIKTLETKKISAVQVIYNIFDQNPEDELFPACERLDVGIIARVPFDEGTLTGTFTKETTFPANDWRSTYFVPENLNSSVDHADALKPLVPSGMTMAEMALRFILENKQVATTIPGMRQLRNVEMNIGTSDGQALDTGLLAELKTHRWDRLPTAWSQ